VIGETTEDHHYIFPVTGGSYAPVQVQEISIMLPCRVTDHLRSRNRAAVAICLLIVLLAAGPAAAASEAWTVRSDWSRHFAEAGVRGTLVVVDERVHPASRWVHDESRAHTRFIPASTFKIPHALIALDAGAVRDEFQVFRWDGTRRDIESWNRDQDLRSSMRNSVVWVYQHIARSIGEDGERRYLQKIGYGNADPSGGIDRFWLDGKLAISAEEQVTFLQRLYRNELPFRVEHQRRTQAGDVAQRGERKRGERIKLDRQPPLGEDVARTYATKADLAALDAKVSADIGSLRLSIEGNDERAEKRAIGTHARIDALYKEQQKVNRSLGILTGILVGGKCAPVSILDTDD
jgi:beta-lactamase class D